MLGRAFLTCPALGALLSAATLASDPGAPPGGARAGVERAVAPAAFVANEGQWDAGARFRIGHGPVSGWILDDGFVIDLRGAVGCALGFRFEGARPVEPRGLERSPGRRHFLGARSRADVAAFESVRYDELLDGVDLVLRPGLGLFQYDLELAAGADLERVAIAVEGADALAIDVDGALRIETPAGLLRQSPPVAWTLSPEGERAGVACRFRLLDGRRFGFEAPGRARGEALVVDPGLEWGSYVGDYDHDACHDVALAPNGDVIVAGTSASNGFPATRGAYDLSLGGGSDAFVARVSADGRELVFATYLGGSGAEIAWAVEVPGAGPIFVAGETSSPDFPVTAGAQDTTHNGGFDAFVAAIADDGASLVLGTFLGGLGDDRARDLSVDASLRATLAGSTNSGNFPTSSTAYDTTYNGGSFGGGDAFVARLGPSLAGLEYSTYLGGTANETAIRLAVDASGRATVVGVTGSGDFPITLGSFDPTPGGSGVFQDGFVTRLAANGSSLAFSSFLGGSANDSAWGVAARGDGALAVVGGTESADFPTTPNAFDATPGGGEDGFLVLVSPSGATLELASFLGGLDRDRAYAVAFDPTGVMLVAGGTRSPDFPVTPWAWDKVIGDLPGASTGDAFVARATVDGALAYASFLGGRQDDEALSLAPLPDGRAIVCGHTSSIDFPTINGFDPYYDFSGVPDGFVCRMEFSRFPFAYGTPAPSSAGYVADVGASFASFVQGTHQIYIDFGVPQTTGWLFRGSAAASIPFMGTTLCVAPPFKRHSPVQLDYFGADTIAVPISAAMVGSTRWWQFWYLDPGSPQGIALSPGIEVTYYP